MVGHSGLYQGIAMFLVAYFIICMTVLSVCAISTNGALDAGGAYCILFARAKIVQVEVGGYKWLKKKVRKRLTSSQGFKHNAEFESCVHDSQCAQRTT